MARHWLNKGMKLFLTLLLMLLCNPLYAAHIYPEKYYQNQWCNRWGGIQEYRLPDKTHADCVTKNFATEFDFAPKWAEAIGQSLYYSKITGKKPAIILIVEKPSDFRYYKRAKTLTDDLNISLWYMKSPQYLSGFNDTKQKSLAYKNQPQLSIKDIETLMKNINKALQNYL